MMFGEALAPPYTQRLLIGRNPKGTARGTVLSGLFSIPFFIVTGMIGFTAYALGVAKDASSAMPDLVQAVLPLGIRGVVMAAMVSIIMSAARRLSQRGGGGAGQRHDSAAAAPYVG